MTERQKDNALGILIYIAVCIIAGGMVVGMMHTVGDSGANAYHNENLPEQYQRANDEPEN